MATSGTRDFNPRNLVVITEAFSRCGLNPETLKDWHFKSALDSFNFLMAEWSSRKTPLFAIQERVIPLEADKNTYILEETSDPDGNPLKGIVEILSAVKRQATTGSLYDIQMTKIGVEEWNRIADKETVGEPFHFLFRELPKPQVQVWYMPDSEYLMTAECQVKIQDFSDLSDTADIPYKWMEALAAGMACKLSAKFVDDMNTKQMLKAEYEQQYRIASEADSELLEIEVIPPNYFGRGGV